MRVVVTRPAAEGRAWAETLGRHGFDAEALPLIDIAPLEAPQRQVLAGCWALLPQQRAVMFVSAAAAEHFLADVPPRWQWPAGTRAWAPGPGTAAVLVRLGVPAAAIDAPAADAAQLDSESLWDAAGQRIAPGDGVLIVRGVAGNQPDADGTGHGRAWMAERLAQAGARVQTVVAYRRGPPDWDRRQAEHAAALARPDTVWLFSNSEAIAHLFALLPQAGAALRQGGVVATHPRIGTAAAAAGFARIVVAHPGIDGVMAALRGLKRAAPSSD